ncbi:MAG: MMPL family transporter [Hyphomicrobiaceae bacterium]|nr:MMPL family transporter [Hyphomicrobiaceae bacterium]
MVRTILMFGATQRLVAFAILVALTAGAVLGMSKLTTDTSRRALISAEDPGWPGYRDTIDTFGSDNITVVFISDPELFTEAKLKKLEALHYDLLDLDAVKSVDSLINVTTFRYRDGGLDTGELLDGRYDDADALKQAVENASANPLILGDLINKDGTATALVVAVSSENTPNFLAKVFQSIEDTITPAKGEFAEVFQIGPPRLEHDLAKGIQNDFRVLLPVALLILIASIVIFLRTPRFAIVPVSTSLISILWTFGFMGLVGLPVTLLSSMIPSLIIVIGSTEDTHLLAAYLDGLREGNEEETRAAKRRVAIRYMARHMGLPILITSFTTAFGFGSNAISEIPMIQGFAYSTSFAMIANLVATVLMVPLLLSVMGPTKAPEQKSMGGSGGLAVLVANLFEKVAIRHGKLVLTATALVVLVVGSFAYSIRVNDDPLANFRADHPITQAGVKLHDQLAGMQVFNVVLKSDDTDAFRGPENLKKVEAAAQFMRDQNVFDKITSLADYVSLVNREINRGKKDFYKVPDTREEIDQYLLLYKRDVVDGFISPDGRKAKILVRHYITDTYDLRQYIADLRTKLDEILGDDITYELTGESLMISSGAQNLVTGQFYSLLLLILVIYAIMSFLFTSLAAGLVSLVPNLMPLILNFGTMGLLGIPLNPGTALVAVIAMGIAIDDTSHLMIRYSDERRNNPDPDKAILETVRLEAIPVVSTSIGLAGMFLTLLFSTFNNIAQFGLLAAATMIYAMLADLFITPLILRHVRLVGVWDIIASKVGTQVLVDSPVFRGMSPRQIKKAILLSETEDVDKGDIVILEGSAGDKMYLVLSGEIDVLRDTDVKKLERGADASSLKKVGSFGPGEVFGEIGFVAGNTRTATCVAAEPSTLLVFSPEGKDKALRLYPRIEAKLNQNISRTMAERLAMATRQKPDVSF